MNKTQLQTLSDLVSIAHDEYDGCSSYRDDLDTYDKLLADMKAEASVSHNAPGDAAAMRAALEDSLKFWNSISTRTRREENLRLEIAAALAAPPRNCDVGTMEEQLKRWESFCSSNWSSGSARRGLDPCDDCKLVEYGNCRCQLAWAQMPYEEKEKPSEQHQ